MSISLGDKCKTYYNNSRDMVKQILQDERLVGKYYLAVIQVGSEGESTAYIKGKINDFEYIGSRVEVTNISINESGWITKITTIIDKYNQDLNCAGIIVEVDRKAKNNLPQTFWQSVYNSIVPFLDIDGLRNNSMYIPCTAAGAIDFVSKVYKEIYHKIELDFRQQTCTVIGRSKLVGKPIVDLLIEKGATVFNCNSKTFPSILGNCLYSSTIIFSAAGSINLIHPEMISSNTLIIDIGTNFNEETKKLVGDTDPKVYEMNNKTIYYTPVPGGMGLITRAILLEHFIKAINYRERQFEHPKMTLKLSDKGNGDFVLIPTQGDFNV